MMKRNLLPDWYPATCHIDNIEWNVSQWVDALTIRSRLVKAEIDGELDIMGLEAIIVRNDNPPLPQVTMTFPIDVRQSNAMLLRQFITELDVIRKQTYLSSDSGVCLKIKHKKSKFKLLSFMEGLDKLHRLRVLDWIDLALWSRLSKISLDAGYLGDIFWPNEEIDRRYRLVTKTRPLACQLLNQSVIYNLSMVRNDL
jgi:hypothetical protein